MCDRDQRRVQLLGAPSSRCSGSLPPCGPRALGNGLLTSGAEYTGRAAPPFVLPSFLFSFSLYFSEAVSFSKPFPCLFIFYLECLVQGEEGGGHTSHLTSSGFLEPLGKVCETSDGSRRRRVPIKHLSLPWVLIGPDVAKLQGTPFPLHCPDSGAP